VLFGHVFKNALIPILTILGPIIPHLFTGTIFVEAIFRVPGMGKWFVQSILERDYPVIMGLSLLSAAFTTLMYHALDVSYRVIDPRLKLE
jgi:ABC-type dipeptide/oligopeptide/nickel transport system permease component